ncbi:hypothetical protein HanXRQr2_Chr11g0499261 [Helianthus annuus]|uniref:Uncharacterized protein n=1 Tax=Helianthus annuus TaxID=4232 RepID=A0A9K3HQR0_HELAN|nr:hypothetical protein HanXRQr2_Chr11g0499261 [Helianthus annuus]
MFFCTKLACLKNVRDINCTNFGLEEVRNLRSPPDGGGGGPSLIGLASASTA